MSNVDVTLKVSFVLTVNGIVASILEWIWQDIYFFITFSYNEVKTSFTNVEVLKMWVCKFAMSFSLILSLNLSWR